MGKGRPSPPRRRGFLAGIAADFAEFAESVGNVVALKPGRAATEVTQRACADLHREGEGEGWQSRG